MQYTRLSISFICLAFALVSFSARADYQADIVGTFRCSKLGPDAERASVWRIAVPNNKMSAPFVEFSSPAILDVHAYTVRGYGTVTELHASTVVTVLAPLQGGGYFNLNFSQAGVRMGDTPCYKVH